MVKSNRLFVEVIKEKVNADKKGNSQKTLFKCVTANTWVHRLLKKLVDKNGPNKLQAHELSSIIGGGSASFSERID